MDLTDILHALRVNLSAYDITLYAPASASDFARFKRQFHFELPEEVKALYQFCNGFESAEDLFRIIPLDEIVEDQRSPGPNRFYFAEYMLYSDMWEVNVNPMDLNSYTISNTGDSVRLLTHSIAEFLSRFLAGGVFGKGGLYDWHAEKKITN